MDESFKVNNRWLSGHSDEGAYNVFSHYARGGNESSRQNVNMETMRAGSNTNNNLETHTQRQLVTEVSQVSYADRFKKMKFNQMETLK